MKKITLISILTLCMACPSMADIAKNAQSATCDSSTIGTTTGPANLQAAWTANTINLDFYSNDTKVGTGTCSYDGAITLPSTPSIPTGYTFGGWKVRAAAPVQVTYTACSQITNETVCGQNSGNGCVWYNGACHLQACDAARSESWCETALNEWTGDTGNEGYVYCGMNLCGECVWNPKDPC